MSRMKPLMIAGLIVGAAWLATPSSLAVGEDDTQTAPPPPRRPLAEQSPREGGGDGERDGDRGRRPDERGRFDFDRDRPVELTDEQVEKYMTVIRLHFPDFAERLERLRTEKPDEFRTTLGRMGSRVGPMVRDMERDPDAFEQRVEMFKLNGEIYRTARRIREAADAEKPAIKAELRELLDKQFDLRIKEAERDIAGLEKRIEQLRHELTERRDNRQKLVDERLEQVMAMSDRFGDGDRRPGFDGPPPAPGNPGGPGAPGDGPPRRGGFAPEDGPPPPRPGETPPQQPPPADSEPKL